MPELRLGARRPSARWSSVTVQQHWLDVLDAVDGAPNRQGPVARRGRPRHHARRRRPVLLDDARPTSGATVIKIEHPASPTTPATSRRSSARARTASARFFAQFNRNKLGVTLDLKAPRGQGAAARAGRARPTCWSRTSGPARWTSSAWATRCCARRTQRSSTPRSPASGSTGPSSRKPAYDNSGQATGGLWSMNGYPDRAAGARRHDHRRPLRVAVCRLRHARRAARGRAHRRSGQLVDVSQQDSVLSLTENAVVSYTVDGKVAGAAGQRPSVRAALRPVPVPGRPRLLRRLHREVLARSAARIFGEPELADDPEIDTMEQALRPRRPTSDGSSRSSSAGSPTRTKAELEEMAGDQIPLSAVKDIAEVVADPQIAARDMIVDVPVAGKAVRDVRPADQAQRTPGDPRALAPAPGEHNDDVSRAARSASTPTASPRCASRARSEMAIAFEPATAVADDPLRPAGEAQRADAGHVRRARPRLRPTRATTPVGVVVLTGAGDRAFCVGADLDESIPALASGPLRHLRLGSART